MANSKISALTSATTPLAGTETLPVVQSSATTKVTVANLTAGRAVSALSVTTTADSTINGLNVGKGGGAVASNTSVGFQALNGNATGFQMVAVGYQAGAVNTANNFTAVGYQAGLVNTTGGINTFLGFKTGVANVDGGGITAVGDRALQTNISGNFNVAVGTTALGLATGSNCTSVGYNAGSTATSGSNNGFFGFGSAPSSITVSNEYTYGNASVTNHRFTAGNITALTGNVVIGTTAKGITTGSAIPLGLGTNGSTTQVTIDTSGNFGIGATPATKLDVLGTVQAAAAATQDAVRLAGRAGGTGTFAVTLTPTTLTASRTLTLPDATTTVVGTDATQTLTNKWVQPRVLASTANSATPTLNTDNYDMMVITGQVVAITSFTTNLTGTPVNGQKLIISITGTVAIGITWGAKFEPSTVPLPTTTFSTNRLDVGFIWNVATSAWRCVAVA